MATMTDRKLKCSQRIGREWKQTRHTLDLLLNPDKATEAERDDLGIDPDDPYRAFSEYGLSFDYVAPGTFERQREGYWRYQLSWGGPSDEFRFYASDPQSDCYKIQYWFLDWFDGAHKNVTEDEIARRLWDEFRELGMTESERDKAVE